MSAGIRSRFSYPVLLLHKNGFILIFFFLKPFLS
ncbi:hypothetical protein LSS_22080 [Leptospira santarosai serovar Shermani str. LT 821]|uniref:Uncharacterized protein n=1 Tax=Leptospira santarosai serovar Shermani str. LT 821 TaxID=758847 RepID=A0A097ESP1_9LEPT|nr:hypothetical protein LSS_22080 [Leptospira santarosai serovar Shermani str. LT 821]